MIYLCKNRVPGGNRSAKKITNRRYVQLLFGLCWVAYTVTYIGRLNYNAVLADILINENITKSQAGMISTSAFVTYGAGQIVNGFSGDYMPPKRQMFFGLMLSAVTKFIMGSISSYGFMMIIWSINGFAQSMTWTPVLRALTEFLQAEPRKRMLVHVSTCVPAGTLLAYLLAGMLVAVTSWRAVFFLASAVLMGTAVLWFGGISLVEKHRRRYGIQEEEKTEAGALPKAASLFQLLLLSGAGVIGMGSFMHGFLKDGVTTWAPAFLTENFGVSSSFSILAAMALPVVNLIGVYGASWMNRRHLRNEVLTAGVCFFISAAALGLLFACGNYNIILSIILLALVTSAMLGVNTMLISLMPAFFTNAGKVAAISGILNAMAYLGSAVSSYATGAVAQYRGWNDTIFLWILAAVFGISICAFTTLRWKKFAQKIE